MIHPRNIPRLAIYDDGLAELGPLTRYRAAFSVRTGALNNRVRIEVALGCMASALFVEGRLAELYRGHETDASVNAPCRAPGDVTFHVRRDDETWGPVTAPGDSGVLLVNGRLTGALPADATAISTLEPGQAIAQQDGQVVAARLDVAGAQAFVDSGFRALPDGVEPMQIADGELVDRPWEIFDHLERNLGYDLAGFKHCVADSASVHPSAELDESRGPVVICGHARIGPLAVLEGPCWIGPHAVVQPHALIRANTVVGEHCKVAGEVSASVLQGYSNKAHDGFLGHALVGQWVNLGAGTTVSNLKNTYGSVRMQLRADTPPEDTGRMFLGPIIGDHTRTAIGTRLPTGAVIEGDAMLAVSGFAPRFIPRRSFITDDGAGPHDVDALVEVVKTMMARRDVVMTEAVEKLIRA